MVSWPYTYITILTPTTVAPYDTFCNREKVLEVVEPRAIVVASRIISGADDTYIYATQVANPQSDHTDGKGEKRMICEREDAFEPVNM